MATPSEQLIIVDASNKRVDIQELTDELRQNEKRVLADDELGIVLYVGDLNLYSLKPLDTGEFLAQKLREISRPRFPARLIRHQIGSAIFSMTGDTVFLVSHDGMIRKVRADKLKPGMTLTSGEKVFS